MVERFSPANFLAIESGVKHLPFRAERTAIGWSETNWLCAHLGRRDIDLALTTIKLDDGGTRRIYVVNGRNLASVHPFMVTYDNRPSGQDMRCHVFYPSQYYYPIQPGESVSVDEVNFARLDARQGIPDIFAQIANARAKGDISDVPVGTASINPYLLAQQVLGSQFSHKILWI